jgi:cell division protein FtsL
MATLDILNNLFGARAAAGAAAASSPRAISGDFELRPLPNEDVFMFVKRIDNSRVVRQADPKARAGDWRVIGGAAISAALLIGVLLPGAYSLMAGYQLSTLQRENQKLQVERTQLELQEAQLLSTERLEQIARDMQLVDPAPDSTIYLEKKDASLALNRQ